jgi:hypothetical protein
MVVENMTARGVYRDFEIWYLTFFGANNATPGLVPLNFTMAANATAANVTAGNATAAGNETANATAANETANATASNETANATTSGSARRRLQA